MRGLGRKDFNAETAEKRKEQAGKLKAKNGRKMNR